jgi:hypothetical protein
MKVYTILFLILILCPNCNFSQELGPHWNTVLIDEIDSRFDISYSHYYSSGGMGSNYEEIRYFLKNKTGKSFKMKATVTVEYTCGRVRTYVLDVNKVVSLKPYGTWDNESDWVHLEFTNWNKKECIKKLDELKYTTIEKVSFVISDLIEDGKEIELTKPVTTSSVPNNNNNNNTQSSEISSACPDGGFSFQSRIIREESVDIVWLNQAPNFSTSSSGDFKTHGEASTDFVFSIKPKNSLIWKEITFSGYGGSVNIDELKPCISYDVKMQRVCSDNKRSKSTTIGLIETACPKPVFRSYEHLNNSSIELNYTKLKTENSPTIIYQTIIQYKPGGSNIWITKVFTEGQKIILTGLRSNSQYEVRARFQYSSTEFSEYSKNEIFHTNP